MPGVRNSGISATVGLVVVVAVLLVAGAIVVSDAGLLSQGGLLGGGGPAGSPGPDEPAGTAGPGVTGEPDGGEPVVAEGDFSCGELTLRDPATNRWELTNVVAAAGDGFEQLKLSLQRASGRSRQGPVRAEWLSPDEAVQRFEIPRPGGTRALALRFEGTVDLGSDRAFDAAALDDLGLRNMRSVQVSSGPDGRTIAVVGVAGEGCARLSSPRWARRGTDRNADILLDVEAP